MSFSILRYGLHVVSTVSDSLILVFDLITTPQFLGVDPLWSWQALPPAWRVQYIQVLRPHWALPLWRTALPASHPMVKLTLLYIPLGRCCLSILSALMAELTSVGRKKIHAHIYLHIHMRIFYEIGKIFA